ncbi:transcriptional regulator with XRE-family HTH domain [Nocardiopsis mwathae]|uniref:Transcriptional regulator with XRE-family HTH domain n=1 Tax=Nocardiopsis mwathae TaxID=1472723 RepID=A0A7X0D5G6_9ACTN|nr:transcriptional regulator with XRE-family HTH domain [Nocardiopsis mwathae]
MTTRIHTPIGPTGAHAARAVREHRANQGKTTEALADELTRLGVPLQATAITKIEKAQRKVTVDELAALATALNTTPNALLLPTNVDRDRPLRVTGCATPMRSAYVWDWFTTGTGVNGRRERSLPWWLRANDVEAASGEH